MHQLDQVMAVLAQVQQAADVYLKASASLAIVSGLVIACFGYPLHILLIGLVGLFYGGGLGALVGAGAGHTQGWMIIGLLAGAAIGSSLAVALYRLAIFLAGAGLGAGVTIALFGAGFWVWIGAILGGVMTIVVYRWAVMLYTAVWGASLVSSGAMRLLHHDSRYAWVGIVLAVLVFIVGLSVQAAVGAGDEKEEGSGVSPLAILAGSFALVWSWMKKLFGVALPAGERPPPLPAAQPPLASPSPAPAASAATRAMSAGRLALYAFAAIVLSAAGYGVVFLARSGVSTDAGSLTDLLPDGFTLLLGAIALVYVAITGLLVAIIRRRRPPAGAGSATGAAQQAPTAGFFVSGAFQPLAGTSASIGRDPSCDIRVTHERASRRHAALKPTGDGGWVVEDAGSANGTTVNGAPVTGPTPLAPGDRVGLGGVEIVFWRAGKA